MAEKIAMEYEFQHLLLECYKGIAKDNQDIVDKNCLTADILTYKCESLIDAANYIGVTFDIRQGYSMKGYRGKPF